MFTTVLVANRGEIACRVLRAAHALGYRTVAVATPPDADAPHAALADRCVHLADPRAYLDPDALIDAARRAGADALHPGYGFLSERADFARAVIAAGLTWIGPPPEAIAAMGDKAAAKARMRAAGVPVLPGTELLDPTDADLRRAAEAIGFPLLVKASAGGGGRGLRKVVRPEDLDPALASARAEAHGAFGDGRLLLERLVTAGRHVEVQVLADAHGAVIHLGERDCSAQRRHQKVIEEAPSPAVDAALRAALGEAACAAARSVGYVGAGTVELLLEPDGRFWFLEMNTRLQVEHPVTELVTGLDLVALQLRVAAGEPLPLAQGDVALRGHAIEARLYAEDPAHDFRPATGPVLAWSPPAGEGVRVDHGLAAGQEISPHYDPMVAKLIAWGPDRATATRRLRRALRETTFLGPSTNLGFLDRLLGCEAWTDGAVTTAFLDADAARPLREAPPPTPETTALAAALWLERHARGDAFRPSHRVPAPLHLARDGERVITATSGSNPYEIAVGDAIFRVALRPADGPRRRAVIDGTERPVDVAWADGALHLAHLGDRATFTAWDPSPAPAEEAGGDGIITAPTAGTVRAIPVEPGARVAADAVVAVVEAMKIETPLRAGLAGVVAEVRASAGAAVRAGQVLVVVKPEEESP